MKECFIITQHGFDGCCRWDKVCGVTLDYTEATKLAEKFDSLYHSDISVDEWDEFCDEIWDLYESGDIKEVESYAKLIDKYCNTDYTLEQLIQAERVFTEAEDGYIETSIEKVPFYGNID